MLQSSTPRPRYPIFIVSKGRSDCCLTAKFMEDDGVDYRIVVEPQEADAYSAEFGQLRVVSLPFSNLGLGSIPARNWCWETALKEGHARHWVFDDNIRQFRRWQRGKRIPATCGPAIMAAEDFVDRYENVAIAGFNYSFFGRSKLPPFFLNTRVYSSLLVMTSLPYRWRGRYNEDTDLCLQVLSGGWCTVLFNAMMIEKMMTMSMKGGNSDQLYKGDGRLKMARSLERVWPGVVDVRRRFKRPQHHVKGTWRKFDTQLKRRPDVDFDALRPNNYGWKLRQLADDVRSAEVRKMLEEEG